MQPSKVVDGAAVDGVAMAGAVMDGVAVDGVAMAGVVVDMAADLVDMADMVLAAATGTIACTYGRHSTPSPPAEALTCHSIELRWHVQCIWWKEWVP